MSLKPLLPETFNQRSKETFILVTFCSVKSTMSALLPELTRSQMRWLQWKDHISWLRRTGFITKLPYSNRSDEHIQHNRTSWKYSAQNFALQQSACGHVWRRAVFQCWAALRSPCYHSDAGELPEAGWQQIVPADVFDWTPWFHLEAEMTIDGHQRELRHVRNLVGGS